VILVARRSEALKKVSEACTAAHKDSGVSQGGKFATVQLDVSDKGQVAKFWDAVPKDLRDVDILGGFCSILLTRKHLINLQSQSIPQVLCWAWTM
jgi:3-hydroxy acid dehydrogenase/malonic semialdehyde reductase